MSGNPPKLPRAVRGFDRAAEAYERSRPGYPAAAVAFLRRELRLGPGRTVVDLGSGTGKLTRSLLGSGAAVVAVEPTAGMRRVFRRVLPSVVVVDGTAEAIPLPDGFADALVVGQAFHWFRTAPALREIRRVLRPGGRLALLWNVRDESFELSARVSELLDRRAGRVAHARELRWQGRFERSRAGFGPLRYRAFRQVATMDRTAFVERFLSVSSVAILPRERRRAIAEEIRRLVAELARGDRRTPVALPYRTDVYVARRA